MFKDTVKRQLNIQKETNQTTPTTYKTEVKKQEEAERMGSCRHNATF